MGKLVKVNTNKDLKKAYEEINDWYFSNKLPVGFLIHFGKCHKKSATAQTEFWKDGEGGKTGKIIDIEITILPNLGFREKILSLIHEMIHIKFYMAGHGTSRYSCHVPKHGCYAKRPWSKEVRRLARLGLFDWLI